LANRFVALLGEHRQLAIRKTPRRGRGATSRIADPAAAFERDAEGGVGGPLVGATRLDRRGQQLAGEVGVAGGGGARPRRRRGGSGGAGSTRRARDRTARRSSGPGRGGVRGTSDRDPERADRRRRGGRGGMPPASG